MKKGHAKRIRRDTTRLFLKKGTCSRALFFILDREFGHPRDDEERIVFDIFGHTLGTVLKPERQPCSITSPEGTIRSSS